MTESNNTKRIVISGAGLVGSLLAIILKKRGHQVTVFEKRPDMRKETLDGGRSINLIVTSRGINALQTVDMWDKVKGITVPVTGRMMHSTSEELTYQPYGRDDSECNYSISRGGLNKLLMTEAEAIGVEIKFECEAEDVNFNDKKVLLSNKTECEYDLLFGTDGGGSKIRKALLKHEDHSSEEVQRLNSDYKEMLMPASASGDYLIEKNALHIWPRGSEMLMALPNQDGSFTMTLYMPNERFEEINDSEKLEKYFDEYYPDAKKLMPDYQKEYFENPQGMLATLFASPWTDGSSVALLGDAAHAIVPFFGQGMNCGFEDCFYLMKFFDETKDWTQTFEKYNSFQKPNGDAIAKMAIENFTEMSDLVGDEKFLFRKQVEKEVEKKFPNKYRARYGLVTYTLAPYSLVLEVGKIQNKILDELCNEIKSVEEIDFVKAEKLIDELLIPFQSEHQIDISRFKE